MTPEDAQASVRAIYPEAYAELQGFWFIYSDPDVQHQDSFLGSAVTKRDAWINAWHNCLVPGETEMKGKKLMKQDKFPSEQEFLKHVASHEMTVLLEEETHRHLRFKQPGSMNRYFDLITWPGSLCFTGDMGTYVFSRVPDMFTFFRSDYKDDGLHINPQYWAEKLDAADRRTGGAADEYSPEKFKKQVAYWLTSMEASRATRLAVKDQVLSRADDGEFWAMKAAMEFEHNGERLSDFWEANLRDYTYHFIWCCYALVWAIKQYDAVIATATKQAA